ncbi:hypothetical protein FS749_006611 [Ceratobasidium sp. UAMH 11750]|nr:hypothetical protein FS749_006611 [Ceratobasidium sp. UAMH 11750]
MHSYNPLISASHRLPPEILLHLIDILSILPDNTTLEPLDQSSAYPRAPAKPDFAPLRGLNGSCRMYHEAVQRAWYRILYVRKQRDWEMVEALGIARHVRELRVLSPALGRGVRDDVFLQFSGLHTAFIDAHNDFEVNPDPASAGLPSNSAASSGQCRRVAPYLPSSLRRLWITNAHGPDISIINTLISCCPQLLELSISRCTLFSPRSRPSYAKDAQCTFWATFPTDHNSYFASEEIEDYATILSQVLRPLQHLRFLHMGLYVTPHEAISVHLREHHKAKDGDDSPWDLPCEACSQRYSQQTRHAEAAANTIIFRELPQLQHMSWASFFTANRQDAIIYVSQPEALHLGTRPEK